MQHSTSVNTHRFRPILQTVERQSLINLSTLLLGNEDSSNLREFLRDEPADSDYSGDSD